MRNTRATQQSRAMTGTYGLDGRSSSLRLLITLAIAIAGSLGMWSIIVILPAVQAEFGTARGGGANLPPVLALLWG